MNRRSLLRKAALISPPFFLPGCQTVSGLAQLSQFLIPSTDIAARLKPFFPFSQTYQNLGQLSLANPVFAMLPEQNKVRIGLTTGVTAGSAIGQLTGIPVLSKLAGTTTAGTCQVACGLRYDRETRGIYLQNPVVERLDIQNLSSTFTNPFRQLLNTFGPGLLDQRPIHTLDPSLASRFLKGIQVQPTGVALKFGV